MDIRGHTVQRLWIERASHIAHEYYASFTLDRGARKHLGMVSAKGGVDIEQVADEDPGAIARLHVDPVKGLSVADARQLIDQAGLDPEAREGAVDILTKLYRCFVEGDADLVEINPLVLTPDGRVHALDAKVSLDNNAEFRHPEWQEYRATEVLDEREHLARLSHSERRGWLVEEDDTVVPHHRAGDGHRLPLAARKRRHGLAD